jgi:hypothetical protein
MSSKQVVALSFDLNALKQSLRFAFASDLTVIQELIQNARRAGATTVWVNTGMSPAGTPVLTVLDNGVGLEDFQVLLSVATSGWSDETKAAEGPYGLGFLSAVYSAKHVEVISRGKVVRLDQERVLSDGQFEVQTFEGELPPGAVTSVALHGINVEKVAMNIAQMVKGYPIDIVFNGTKMERADSLDGSFTQVGCGHIKRNNLTFSTSHIRVYLQGFCVHQERIGYRATLGDIVHLDPTKFHGKFPDRDVVINQVEMLKQVHDELRSLYVETLIEAKKRLDPGVFIETYYDLANSLGMLKIFNDLDVLPKSFLDQVHALPHDSEFTPEYLHPGMEGEFFTRADLEAPDIILGDLDKFYAEDDTDNTRRWIFAYAAGAWMISKPLDEGHWVHSLVTLHGESDVTMDPVVILRKGVADSMRLQCVGAANLVLCKNVLVTMNGDSHLVGEPVYDEEANAIYITMDDGVPAYVSDLVLQQISSYRWDDDFHEDECDEDVHAINQMARELASDTPEEQLALSLEAAISDYSKIRSMSFTAKVDDKGKVEVLSLGPTA